MLRKAQELRKKTHCHKKEQRPRTVQSLLPRIRTQIKKSNGKSRQSQSRRQRHRCLWTSTNSSSRSRSSKSFLKNFQEDNNEEKLIKTSLSRSETSQRSSVSPKELSQKQLHYFPTHNFDERISQVWVSRDLEVLALDEEALARHRLEKAQRTKEFRRSQPRNSLRHSLRRSSASWLAPKQQQTQHLWELLANWSNR